MHLLGVLICWFEKEVVFVSLGAIRLLHIRLLLLDTTRTAVLYILNTDTCTVHKA
jgi:hypothetical protein